MWNCGDDFIGFGVRNIIDYGLGQKANYIAYNRNPDLHLQRIKYKTINFHENGVGKSIDLSQYIARTNWVFDNSWHPRNSLENFSAVIFAGTPESFGPMVQPLTAALAIHELPVFYLGIGGFEGRDSWALDKLEPLDQQQLKNAALITVRDEQAENLLKDLNPVLLPCPALFSNTDKVLEKNRRGTRKKLKIALTTQPDKSLQPLSGQGVYEYTLQLFRALIECYDCEVVCHYLDEVQYLAALNVPIRYSYDARDYFEIFNQYDLLITTRVHGAGAAASLGIPSFVIAHSARSGTVKGFRSEIINPAEESVAAAMERISAFDIRRASRELKSHKEDAFRHYASLLGPVLKNL